MKIQVLPIESVLNIYIEVKGIQNLFLKKGVCMEMPENRSLCLNENEIFWG